MHNQLKKNRIERLPDSRDIYCQTERRNSPLKDRDKKFPRLKLRTTLDNSNSHTHVQGPSTAT
jgi:hypothetical protein